MVNKRISILIFLLNLSVAFIPTYAQNSAHPNIIIILADDIGYGDLGGWFGGEAHTPNLNSLAKKGILFTDFHSNGAMCSPTRAALLTGRYQQRVGIEDPLPGFWEQPGKGKVKGISDAQYERPKTIANYLKETGYATAFYGKWHLGNHPDANPTKFGFDEFKGLTSGCGDYFSKIDRYGYPDWWHNDQLIFQKGYATDVITSNGINFIEQHKKQPFFLYLAHLGVHFPWQSPDDAQLQTREQGKDFTSNKPGTQSKLGPHKPKDVPAVLHEMIESLDRNIGRLVQFLEEEGLADNTFIFFSSDNGQYLNYDDSTWPIVGSNGKLRGEKGDLYEGGHRVPAIAYWPKKIPENVVSDETLMSMDILPTLLEITGHTIPDRKGKDALDGSSFLDVLLQNRAMPERTVFWKTPEEKAARKGEWKVLFTEENKEGYLFNLANDIGERENKKSLQPEIFENLTMSLNAWEKGFSNTN